MSFQPFQLILQEKDGKLEVYGKNLTAEVDEQHLGNTLSNLLDNAIKYSGEKKPDISLEVSKKANRLSILIKDKGIGMEKERERQGKGKEKQRKRKGKGKGNERTRQGKVK